MKRIYFLAMIVLALGACEGDQGDPGPKGDQGDQGEQGPTGPKGDPGEDVGGIAQDGFIRGKLTGTRADGTTPIDLDFEVTYKEDSFEARKAVNGQDNVYTIEIVRNSRPTYDDGDFFYLAFDYDFTNNTVTQIRDVGIVLYQAVEDNKLFVFDANFATTPSGPQYSLSTENMVFNATTGLMQFDYTMAIPGAFNDSGNDATINGSVEVTLFTETVNRKG